MPFDKLAFEYVSEYIDVHIAVFAAAVPMISLSDPSFVVIFPAPVEAEKLYVPAGISIPIV
jgi:hypothetical protein